MLKFLGACIVVTSVCFNVMLLSRLAALSCEQKVVVHENRNLPPPVRFLSAPSAPVASNAASSPKQQKGFEAQNNHGSPRQCNELLFQFFRGTYTGQNSAQPLKVLDIGGGKGALKRLIEEATSLVVEYKCVDVTASDACTAYNGESVHEKVKSFDIVVFNYVLHHAADSTIGLLQEARTIAKHYVVVQEDVRNGDFSDVAKLYDHEWAGMFRGNKEWEKLFSVLGFTLAHEADPDRTCAGWYEVDRKLYVLNV